MNMQSCQEVTDMDEKKIARINALAKKARTPEGLTPAEKEEQNALRTEYRQSVVGNLKGQLNNTVVIRPDGSSYRPADKKKSK
jgi:uncharacterized protein YnzC (UPF0291/DUF896 family)